MRRQLKKTEWIEFGWAGAFPIQCIPPMKAWVFDFAKIGYPLSKMALTFSNDFLAFYVIKKEYENYGRKFFEKTLKDPNLILKILGETNQAANKIFKMEKAWVNLDFKTLTDAQLIKCHKSLFDVDEVLWRKGQPQNLLEMGNNFVTAYVTNSLKSMFGAKRGLKYFRVITTSRYESFMEKQNRSFVALCNNLEKNKGKNNREKKIFKHWLKYRWMNYGWTGPIISYETFNQNFKEALAHPKILLDLQKKLRLKKQSLKMQSLLLKTFSPTQKHMSIVLRNILECKSRRTDAHSLTYFLADPLLMEIGNRVGLSLNQLRAMDPPRVRTLFKGYDLQTINEEIKYVLYWYLKRRGIKKYTGREAKKIMSPVLSGLPKVEKAAELSGEMAYSGKVRGKVRIIERASEISKFKKGEILVTAMTDPGFVPAMKIAKAVVTNSGGITCHAAIISRELHIPCVIGTKYATKVLNDGDFVEVDADKGIVKKLN